MASTAADVLIESLQDWGIEIIFGLPGDGINELWKHFGGVRTKCGLFRRAMKRLRPLWPAAMLNTVASWGFAWPHPARAGFTC